MSSQAPIGFMVRSLQSFGYPMGPVTFRDCSFECSQGVPYFSNDFLRLPWSGHLFRLSAMEPRRSSHCKSTDAIILLALAAGLLFHCHSTTARVLRLGSVLHKVLVGQWAQSPFMIASMRTLLQLRVSYSSPPPLTLLQ